jgi:hypothetical protein
VLEEIYNIFIYFKNDLANEVGICSYQSDGTEQQKLDFLRSKLNNDHKIANRFTLDKTFTPEQWRAQMRLGNSLEYFEDALASVNAQSNFLYCMTPIKDGVPYWDQQVEFEEYRGKVATGNANMPDYLVEYRQGNQFNFSQLFNDDYFESIKLLFNANRYVSSAKLLLICVDTIAFIEFDDSPKNFQKWLDQYCDLSTLKISSEELWELRNSMLHMSNLNSKKVKKGSVNRISFYVGAIGSVNGNTTTSMKWFNLIELIHAVAAGISKWGEAYNRDPSKWGDFIERYDTIVSDSRMRWARQC